MWWSVAANASERATLRLVLALLAGGCSRTTDAEVQAAFEQAQRGGASSTPTRARGRNRRAARNTDTDDPWAPVQDKLAQSIAMFADLADASAIEALAERWCEVRPEPSETEDGPAYVCYPKPPLRVSGRSFTLELSGSGVIGLQTDELDGAESRTFAERAREAATRFCAAPWTANRPDEPGPRVQEFHTCPSDGGVTLAVGRYRVGAGDRWRVSLSVLGST